MFNLHAGDLQSSVRHYCGSEPPEPRFIRQGYVLLKPPWIYDIGNGLVYDDLTPCLLRVATPTAYRSTGGKMKRFVCNAAAFTRAQWDARCGHFFSSFIRLSSRTVRQSQFSRPGLRVCFQTISVKKN